MNSTTSNNPTSSSAGPRLWRSIDEYADSEEFQRYLGREFPERAPEWLDPASRRTFLRLMGASLALAGVSTAGCDFDATPPEKVLPYVRQPDEIVQGQSLSYASALSLNGYGVGVLVESNMGRPTFAEGNEKHPDSLGAIDYFTQSALLNLYDPDRSQVVMHGKLISGFDAFVLAAVSALDAQRAKKGAGLRILTETVTSPSLAPRQIRLLLADFPEAKWHQYDPTAPHFARRGAKLAFGRDVAVRYNLAEADVIVSLDADFLACGYPGGLAMARGFAKRREPGASAMNRLYCVEPSLSVTGATADHRLPVLCHAVAPFAQALARAVGVKVPAPMPFLQNPTAARFIEAIAADLQSHLGKSLVIAGESQPLYVHAIAHAINAAMGNVGKTVVYLEPVEAEPIDQLESLAELTRAMSNGKVEALLILGGNPVYTAPTDLNFADALGRVTTLKAHLGYYDDETSAVCDWHIPQSHELEVWGDVRATDGNATIQQPLIAPLYNTSKSAIELIAALLRHPDRTTQEIVRATWKEKVPSGQDFESFWKTAVHDGVVAGSEAKAATVAIKDDLGSPPALSVPKADEYEVVFRPDPTIFDGRFANNGWLQELPKPITKLTWDNVALMSQATADKLRVTGGVGGDGKNADVVRLSRNGRTVEAPVWISPGQPDGSITVTLGYGRTRTGRIGQGVGYNAYLLRSSDAMGFASNLQVSSTGRSQRIACTQTHRNLIETRGLVRFADVETFKKNPQFAHEEPFAQKPAPAKSETLYVSDHVKAPPGEPNHQWGMVVNLNACTGCSACVLACVAENNTPVIGKDQVIASREMHWMEIDRYFHGPPEDPEVYHQPRLCMHCENAPCELVCPVEATVHDSEGLNVMVYNRCVGTRYCSNNCPYKVRHFNFLQYSPKLADPRTTTLALVNNPDVSVRARGVMEKCSYCIQRINEARYTAELEGRPMKDGDVVTACQAACPTQAITFGDVNDRDSAVSKQKADPRNYAMLAELNTRPRTTYLAKLKNPNPTLARAERHDV